MCQFVLALLFVIKVHKISINHAPKFYFDCGYFTITVVILNSLRICVVMHSVYFTKFLIFPSPPIYSVWYVSNQLAKLTTQCTCYQHKTIFEANAKSVSHCKIIKIL